MSIVKYNNITLPYAMNTGFSQDPVYDEVGQVDWCLTKFDIQVQCILHINYMNAIAPHYSGVNPENAAEVMALIRRDLLQPRKQLSYTFNGIELIPEAQDGTSGTVDARNGPQPKTCTIMKLTNTSFMFNYRIVAHYWENFGDDTTPDISSNRTSNGVLFNRWTETVEMDNCEYSRRIREGKYMIRSDNAEGKSADRFRSKMAVVGVPDGCIRESSHYTITPDGLGIKYRVVDKEVFKLPPDGALEAKGYYIESTSRVGKGAMTFGECFLYLRSSKDVPQHILLERAMAIVSVKLEMNGAGATVGDGGVIRFNLLEFCNVKVDMYDNNVTVHAKVQLDREKARIKGLPFRGAMTTTPGSDQIENINIAPATNKKYYSRGTAGFMLQAAAYYDPNLVDNEMGDGEPTIDDNPEIPNNSSQMKEGGIIGTIGTIPEE